MSLVWVASCRSNPTNPPTLPGMPGADATDTTAVDSSVDGSRVDGEPGAGEGGDVTAAPDSNGDAAMTPVDAPLDEGNGVSCVSPIQCNSGVCTAGLCATPSCTDHVRNGQETDVDCGGPTCPACGSGDHCLLARDCQSLDCANAAAEGGVAGICMPPTCTDGIKNGTETDVDCGGGSCPACIIGKHCNTPTDCTSDTCDANECACPAGMIEIAEADTNGGDYCVDPLEVSKSQYAAFWDANPSLGAQPAQCAWNQTYTPSIEWPPTLTGTGWSGGDPVRGVDWCDALAYCTWASKRLCGQIGGGELPPASYNDASKSEWYNACSSNGVNAYPYGASYLASSVNDAGAVTTYRCNDIVASPDGNAIGDIAPFVFSQFNSSGSLNMGMFLCQGGAPGMYNMSGDVAEWENSCSADDTGDAGASDTCLVRGGSYAANQSAADLRCDTLHPVPRSTQDPTIGFRCCR